MSKDPKSNYYDAGGIETLEIIKAKLTPEQFEGYCMGNIMKYLCRYNFKFRSDQDGRERDIEKAKNYLTFMEGKNELGR